MASSRDEGSRVREHIRSNLIGYAALFVALTGTAYAGVSVKSVGTKHLKPQAVTTPKIAGKAVKAPKIAGQAVKPGKIAPQAVKTPKIAPDAVKTGKIANGEVRTPDLAAAAVNAVKIATAAVTGSKVAAGAVTGPKIAGNAVTGPKVNESTLGKVPSAGLADTAENAEEVDGSSVRAIFERVDTNDQKPLATLGGLTLALDCDLGDATIRTDFGATPTAYRLALIQDDGTVFAHEEPNRTGGLDTFFGNNNLFLLNAASGGRTLSAQFQTWGAGQNVLGEGACFYSGFLLIEG